MKTYLVVDLANLVFRARHVVRGDGFDQSGMALHIIFRSLKKLFKERQADHVVLCLEGGGSWRYGEYPAYKSKRRLERRTQELKKTDREKENDEIFDRTIEDFIGFMREKTRCTVLSCSGVEGDDVIARWVQLHPNDNHVILSSDSDLVQLISPTVSIYNGMDDRLMSLSGVFNGHGEPLVFTVDSSSGKIKVGDTIEKERKKHDKEELEKSKRISGYVATPFVFEVEPEWHRKALFVKIIRGDLGDSIFSAYPGVRYKGTSKKIGISDAWEDRNGRGFHWNNFMLQSWEKIKGEDKDGNLITEQTRVLDEYRINERLIDLTKQPQETLDAIDQCIIEAVQKEVEGNIGMAFLKFCHRNNLTNLSKEAEDHAKYLTKGYS